MARVANIGETIRRLKEQGVFVYCADMDGVSLRSRDLTGPIALVMGSEGSGVSRASSKSCAMVLCGWIWLQRAPAWTASTFAWQRVSSCMRSEPSGQQGCKLDRNSAVSGEDAPLLMTGRDKDAERKPAPDWAARVYR